MNDDIDPGLGAGPRPAPPRRARIGASGRVFRWWLGISLLLAIALAACAAIGLHQVDLQHMHVLINDQDVGNITVNGMTDSSRALLAAGALLLAMLVLMLVPLLLVLVLCAVAIALACAVCVPLLAVGLALAAVTSPLWLVALLVWLALRRRPVASATMAA